MAKTRKKQPQKQKKQKKQKKHKTYKKKDFASGDGMVTAIWGPPLWHFLHVISFNYPVHPTTTDKENYKKFIINLKNILPCRYCRDNLKKNLRELPLTNKDLENRDAFSRWMFELHELINTMLNKKSGLKFCDVRERYEHFRARCTIDKKFSKKAIKLAVNKTKKKKEKGCTEPLYGKKSRCIVKIALSDKRSNSFQMDKKCTRVRI
jgi:hypothetical protein|tara:strand:- start:367 stop:987 length:621 start_codon:yes stop_codon:yes gene_type:complete